MRTRKLSALESSWSRSTLRILRGRGSNPQSLVEVSTVSVIEGVALLP
jgi:hypothetical protein